MINEISRNLIRECLDELQFANAIDKDGDLYTLLRADEDFGHDVIVYYAVQDAWLRVFAYAVDYEVEEGDRYVMLDKINKFHLDYIYGTVYIDDHSCICIQQGFLLDEPVSRDYILKNCIEFTTSRFWKFFCDFDKQSFGLKLPSKDMN